MRAEMSNGEFVRWTRFDMRRAAEDEIAAAKAGG